MMPLLTIENLSKSFGNLTPVKNLSMTLHTQSISLITGENGVGKTTLFNLISGLERPDKGTIFFRGQNVAGHAPLAVARKGIIRLYQQPRVFKNLTVWENLAVADHDGVTGFFEIFRFRKMRRLEHDSNDKIAALLSQFKLGDLAERRASELSYGQQKLVSFCMLAISGAHLALLDEPFAGLNPQTIDILSSMIIEMRKAGISFLIIEHNIDKALAITDVNLEMRDGSIAGKKTSTNYEQFAPNK